MVAGFPLSPRRWILCVLLGTGTPTGLLWAHNKDHGPELTTQMGRRGQFFEPTQENPTPSDVIHTYALTQAVIADKACGDATLGAAIGASPFNLNSENSTVMTIVNKHAWFHFLLYDFLKCLP